ncbi:MAG: hypothetical protein IIA99_07260 [Proteobacteria bacterium]|nr:hypothetical protein [Pseudomonadota bacterium]
MTALCVGMMGLGMRNFVHVSLDTGMRQYDGCGYDGLDFTDNIKNAIFTIS